MKKVNVPNWFFKSFFLRFEHFSTLITFKWFKEGKGVKLEPYEVLFT